MLIENEWHLPEQYCSGDRLMRVMIDLRSEHVLEDVLVLHRRRLVLGGRCGLGGGGRGGGSLLLLRLILLAAEQRHLGRIKALCSSKEDETWITDDGGTRAVRVRTLLSVQLFTRRVPLARVAAGR